MDVVISGHGVEATVSPRGAMTTARFTLADGRVVEPLHVAPWPGADDPLLDRLRGDFPCVPFGMGPASLDEFPDGWRDLPPSRGGAPHGYAASAVWDVLESSASMVQLGVEYPEGDPVATVRRIVECHDGAVEFTDIIVTRVDVDLPIGVHPMLRLPAQAGGARLLLPDAAALATPPMPVDASSILATDARFHDLAAAPGLDGSTVDLTALPLADATEELVLVCQPTAPSITLQNRVDGYDVTVEWDTELLAHCLLWFSNRGRAFEPWNGRHLCLGVEPVTSAFDLGTEISAGVNPLVRDGFRTAVSFHAGVPREVSHRIAVQGSPAPERSPA